MHGTPINKNAIKPIKDIPVIKKLNLKKVPKGEVERYWVHIISDGLGLPIYVPLLVARGFEDGPVLGLNAALHGNELNGIPVIQRVFNEIDPTTLRGTLIGVPVMNVPSFVRKKRRFNDGVDLNRIMPGKADGNISQVYASRVIERIMKSLEYLIDLHTASFGRINSYYIRANMGNEVTEKMAILQNADIIVDNPAPDSTLRGALVDMGIPSITLEVGDPQRFQKGMIRSGLTGIFNVMSYLNMIDDPIEEPEEKTVICKRSYWIYTDRGGLLEVPVKITNFVKKGDCIGRIRNVFGDLLEEYYAPENGIVIGKSTNPVAQTGARILHLGIINSGYSQI